jgi:type III secretory pathway component EscV
MPICATKEHVLHYDFSHEIQMKFNFTDFVVACAAAAVVGGLTGFPLPAIFTFGVVLFVSEAFREAREISQTYNSHLTLDELVEQFLQEANEHHHIYDDVAHERFDEPEADFGVFVKK